MDPLPFGSPAGLCQLLPLAVQTRNLSNFCERLFGWQQGQPVLLYHSVEQTKKRRGWPQEIKLVVPALLLRERCQEGSTPLSREERRELHDVYIDSRHRWYAENEVHGGWRLSLVYSRHDIVHFDRFRSLCGVGRFLVLFTSNYSFYTVFIVGMVRVRGVEEREFGVLTSALANTVFELLTGTRACNMACSSCDNIWGLVVQPDARAFVSQTPHF